MKEEREEEVFVLFGEYRIVETVYRGKWSYIFRAKQFDGSRGLVRRNSTTGTGVVAQSEPTCILKTVLARPYQLKREYEIGQLFVDCKHVIQYQQFIDYGETYSSSPTTYQHQQATSSSYPQFHVACVLEDFEGISLERLIPEKGFDLITFLQISIQLATGLSEIHDHNVIHKSIGPANILMNRETGVVKYVDFSCATVLQEENQQASNPSKLTTLAYIAPEQTGRMNRHVDYRTDFYSLGVTMYQLLCGELPFTCNDAMELIHCHIAKEPVSPYHLTATSGRIQVPKPVSDIIMKLMNKNMEDRYQSCRGLLFDLKHCLLRLQKTGSIEPFSIAQSDVSERFIISTKLYGREREIQIILETYNRVCKSRPEVVTVTGYSGVGKSSLINEVQKPVTFEKGYFIHGKFDQLGRNIAYSAISDALKILIKQILFEGEQSIQYWKDKLLMALGSNGRIICDLVPELDTVIGVQPAVPELSPKAARNRLNFIFQKFINVFIDHGPLVIFLDDLQWADTASLSLIESLILNVETKHLLLIGSYRDLEVTISHPSIIMLDNLEQSGVIVQQIVLSPLPLSNTNQLIVDTLGCSEEKAKPLADLVHTRTDGNPYFMKMYLQSLYEENVIYNSDGCWEYELNKLNYLHYNANMAELMIHKLQKLSEPTRQILKVASCLGNSFPFPILETITNKTQEQLMNILYPVFNSGLAFVVEDIFHFSHDKVQEAVYSLLSERKKQVKHLKIGRRLHETEHSNDNLFHVVDHMNKGIPILKELESSEERQHVLLELARLNVNAGERAKSAVAYSSAMSYIITGIECLNYLGDGEAEVWDRYHDLMFRANFNLAEVKYLLAQIEESERLVDTLLYQSKSNSEKTEVYNMRLVQRTLISKMHDAIETGRSALSDLGILLPRSEDQYQVIIKRETEKIGVRMSQLKQQYKLKIEEQGVINALVNCLTNMVDQSKIMVTKILTSLLPTTYLGDPALHQVIASMAASTTLEYGLTSDAPLTFSYYASFLCATEEDEERKLGYELGLLAMELVQQRFKEDLTQKCKVFHIHAVLIHHWFNHIKEVESFSNEAFNAGLESGELLYAGYSRVNMSATLFFKGEKINRVLPELKKYLHFATVTKNQVLIDSITGLQFTLLDLVGRGSDDEKLYEQQSKVVSEMKERMNFFSLANWTLYQAILVYIYNGSMEAAYDFLQETEKHVGYIFSIHPFAQFCFYQSLILVRLIRSLKKVNNDDNTPRIKELTEKLQTNYRKFEGWSRDCPENFQNKHLLLTAEMMQLEFDPDTYKICDLYDRAIEASQTNGFLHEYAISNELSCRFWLSYSKPHIGKTYLLKAYHAYQAWGATRKTDLLMSEHSNLLSPTVSQAILKSFHVPREQQRSPSSNISAQRFTNYSLDLESVIKASQIISSTIDMEKLLYNIMKIIIETAGAQKGAILLDNRVEAEYRQTSQLPSENNTNIQTLCSIPLEHWSNGCQAIIEYVARTRKTVVLTNALEDKQFENNAYISAHKCKSILCMPVTQQNDLKAVLYVENNLTTDAFTEQRVQVLHILTSQMAISLENAKFFKAQLQVAEIQRARAQEAEGYRRKQEDFIDRICHEIRNPLNGIFGNVEMIRSCVDLMEKALETGWNSKDQFKEHLKNMNDGLRAIESCVKHQKVITDDVLSLSKLEASQVILNIAPFRPNELLQTILQMFDVEVRNKSIRVNSILLDKNITVCGDSNRITQVVINLFSNAVKFATSSNQQGEINVCLRALASDASTVELQISIQDNGIGMTEFERQHIFNRFEQATQRTFSEYGGSGLGLFISKNLVELMGGQIMVESEKNTFTKFTFTVKCTLNEPQKEIYAQSSIRGDNHLAMSNSQSHTSNLPISEQQHRTVTALIVEDNAINQKVLLRILRQAGHTCFVANNGAEALDIYDREKLDLIFMDVVMPIMDGIEATRRIREKEAQLKAENSNFQSVPIIGVSGNARKEHEEKAMSVGFNQYMTKPVRKEEVYAKISALFEKSSPANTF